MTVTPSKYNPTTTREITAYLPNPGKLTEILIPGRKLILEHTPPHPSNLQTSRQTRKTEYTVVAAHYKGNIVPLYSARANQIAEKLIIPYLFPNLSKLTSEIKHGNSRIDFFITYLKSNSSKGTQHISFTEAFIEVKACTLIEDGIAMFPDAPTERGKKHLLELYEITQKKDANPTEAHVIFVVMNPTAKIFIPNIHTDPEFTKLIYKLKNVINLHAVSVETEPTGEVKLTNPNIPIKTEPIEELVSNTERLPGIYMLNIKIKKNTTISVGSLGNIDFKEGYYVYVGSALNNLKKRIDRHRRKTKKLKWHIDYLSQRADKIVGYPIVTSKDMECRLAQKIKGIAHSYVKKFGASDCRCVSHLFYFPENPEKNQKFVDILFHFRHKLAF